MPVKTVTAQGLSHSFPGTQLLFRELAFRLSPGEMVGLVGPSGSGKSTLLSILAGWVTPVSGTVECVGIARIGWVLQNPVGVPRRTALDHVALPLLARGFRRRPASDEAAAILDRFKLGEVAQRQFRALSGGEAQRLMLARAVAAAADLLLVDEPTAQLDTATAAEVTSVLSGLVQSDTIVVVATHDGSVRDACSQVIDLANREHRRDSDASGALA